MNVVVMTHIVLKFQYDLERVLVEQPLAGWSVPPVCRDSRNNATLRLQAMTRTSARRLIVGILPNGEDRPAGQKLLHKYPVNTVLGLTYNLGHCAGTCVFFQRDVLIASHYL